MKQIEKMDIEDMKSYIRVASAYGCNHLCLTGGEPFLFKEDILETTKFSKNMGFFVDIRTNGFWARKHNETFRILSKFQKKGLDRLGLSFDKYHRKIPEICTKNILNACKELEMEIYVDCVDINAKKDVVASYLGVETSVIRSCIPPLRLGRARSLNPEEIQKVKWTDFRDSCGKGENYGLSLYITPSGETSLHECCWGNPALFLGNIKLARNRMHFLFECFEKRDSNPLYNFLIHAGPKGLVELAHDVCPQDVLSYYSGECEACFNLLSNLRLVYAIDART